MNTAVAQASAGGHQAGPDAQLPWFDLPRFDEELEQARLPEDEKSRIRFFTENGYLVWRPEIPDFDELAETIATRLRPEHERIGGRVQDAWREHSAVRRLATHPEVMEMLTRLYRRRPIPFQTLNFLRGSEQRTHSDVIHFSSMPEGFMCGVWLALEDVGPDNGPLHYYPGSHRLRVYEPYHLGISAASVKERDRHYESYEDFIIGLGEASGLEKQVVTMRRGEAIIWAANLLHGGEPIRNPQSTRLSQVTHYYFEGCRYYTPLRSDPPLGRFYWRDIVDIGTGERVPHVYNGRPVKLPLAIRARYAVEATLRRRPAGRRLIDQGKKVLRKGG